MIYLNCYTSPLGPCVLASDSKHLVGLWLKGQKYFGRSIEGAPTKSQDLPISRQTENWLDRYFAGQNPPLHELSLCPAGSLFQKTVWELLCEIPYGQTTTYARIAHKAAARMNKPFMSAQAVGGAVGRNPISIIIPCHRVVGTNGSLTGYAGGIDKKAFLLPDTRTSCQFSS